MEQNSSFEEKIKVLLVDDDEEDYLIIKRLFALMKSTNSQLDWVSSSEEAIKAINKEEHDAYLIDYRLDALTGLDVLQEVHAGERGEPFILLTGVGDVGIERESLELAASDYLIKGNLTSDNLSRALFYALGRKTQEKQKLEQLMELNRSKDEFISIASHQLRTPATTVKQYVAMVLDGLGGEISDKQQRLLQKAYDSNERQLSIVNDLLKVAQIDAGKMQLAVKEIEVCGFLTEIIEDFQPLFEQAGQKLNELIEKDVTVTIDKNAIRMVIDNLLENAKKYSEPGSTTTVRVTKQKSSIHIAIIDEGVGIEFPDRLFKKFSRINNKLSTEVGGTGLGLYWAQSISRLHGGDLVYDKNKQKGSTFTIVLPIV
jgi:two-component system sensor histidine kinase/response regulator